MKQQELKDLKRELLRMYDDISDKANDPSRPKPDEDCNLILGALHTTICIVGNRIEAKYK